ncbi:multiprotein-bridging factor 1 family protein [Phaeovulum sp.]|uniref:helix-turn-helix domain-containing protein n=1 Tax=Phaeovulum sp. TaxID=2934796 RepID=UPI00356293D7
MDAESPEEWFSSDVATMGDRLAAARDTAGLTQKALASRLGIKLSTVQAWEEDRSEPRSNRLQMLAGMLNVSLMWLLTGQGDGLTGPQTGKPNGAAADNPLLQSLREIRHCVADLDARLSRLEAALTGTEGKSDERSA